MRFLGFVTGALVLILSSGAQAQPWISYHAMEDRFAIWFPGEPVIENFEWIDVHEDARPARRYTAERNGDVFTVIAIDFTEADWDVKRAAYPHAATLYREKGEEFKAEGYPLENWQAMDQGMVREYNHKRVYTVEQFANMAESNLDNLGLGARTLHTKAKAFLAAHKDTKVAEKYAAQNEELKKQMEILAKSNKDMKDRLDSLEIKKKGKK